MGDDTPQSFELSPRDGGMGRAVLVRQVSGQFANLQQAQGDRVLIDGIGAKHLTVVAKAPNRLVDLVTLTNHMFNYAQIALRS